MIESEYNVRLLILKLAVIRRRYNYICVKALYEISLTKLYSNVLHF